MMIVVVATAGIDQVIELRAAARLTCSKGCAVDSLRT